MCDSPSKPPPTLPQLPQIASDQIQGVKNRPSLIVCTFLRRVMPILGVSSCSLPNNAHAAIIWYFVSFFFVLICFAISVSHRSHPKTTCSVSKHTRNTPPRFSISPTVRRTPYSMRTPVFRAPAPGINHRAASRLRSLSSSLRGLNNACSGRQLMDLCF